MCIVKPINHICAAQIMDFRPVQDLDDLRWYNLGRLGWFLATLVYTGMILSVWQKQCELYPWNRGSPLDWLPNSTCSTCVIMTYIYLYRDLFASAAQFGHLAGAIHHLTNWCCMDSSNNKYNRHDDRDSVARDLDEDEDLLFGLVRTWILRTSRRARLW